MVFSRSKENLYHVDECQALSGQGQACFKRRQKSCAANLALLTSGHGKYKSPFQIWLHSKAADPQTTKF